MSNPTTPTPGTPLPWKMLDRRDNRGNTVGYAVWPDLERPYRDSPRGNLIVSTPDGSGPDRKANAAYIVTACNAFPALVAAIQFYANKNNWKEQETGIGMSPADAHDYGVAARAALAAAGVKT